MDGVAKPRFKRISRTITYPEVIATRVGNP